MGLPLSSGPNRPPLSRASVAALPLLLPVVTSVNFLWILIKFYSFIIILDNTVPVLNGYMEGLAVAH